jgi:hypothetical protein
MAADVHEFQTNVIDSDAFAASAVTEIQSGLATLTNQTAIKTTTDRLATMLVADGAVYQYTANALELAPGGGGGGSGDASQATLLEVQGTVEAIAASLSGTSVTVTSQISQGGEITLYCGDDYRVRSSTQLDVTITDVGGAIYSRLNGIGVANLSFGAARPVQPAGAISGTVASLSQAGSGASQTITIAVEIEDSGAALRPRDDYVWQIVSSEQQGSGVRHPDRDRGYAGPSPADCGPCICVRLLRTAVAADNMTAWTRRLSTRQQTQHGRSGDLTAE